MTQASITKGEKMRYKDAVEIGREEAFELCGCELPTAKVERIIARSVIEGDSVIYKESGKFYIAPFNIENG